MQRLALVLLACFLSASMTVAASFPTLTGRVVDAAHILSPQVQQQLSAQLAQHEATTSNQVVIVTVPSLDGNTIEEYGVALGRHWGIGQKIKNNGVLLIVAPNDHAVRIEVGYGLEGVLTDALTSTIIQSQILPEFRKGNMESGILKGTTSILGILAGDAAITNEVRDAAAQGQTTSDESGILVLLVFLFVFTQFRPILAIPAQILAASGKPGFKRALQASALIPALWWLLPKFRFTGGGGGSSGGGSSSSGFSGGGGSFGGGGSSGRW